MSVHLLYPPTQTVPKPSPKRLVVVAAAEELVALPETAVDSGSLMVVKPRPARFVPIAMSRHGLWTTVALAPAVERRK